MTARRRRRTWPYGLVMAALLAGLAACQPLPQPFAHHSANPAASNPLLTVEDAAGVIVLPVEAAPDALRRAIIAALQDANIPAAAGSGNSQSLFLSGSAMAVASGEGLVTLHLEWDLLAADGHTRAAFAQVQEQPATAWRQGDPSLMQRLAQDVVAALDSALRPAEPTAPTIHHIWIDGGDSASSLALARALRAAVAGARAEDTGLRLAANPLQASLTITPLAGITTSDTGDLITIEWVVVGASGEVGRIRQANTVAAGQTATVWAEIAPLVASAAITGLADLARRTAQSDS